MTASGVAEARGRAWAQTLGTIIGELEQLNVDTEQAFLKIGGEVTGFMRTVNLMSSDLSGLAQLASGEQGRQASEALTGVLEHSKQMGTRSEEGGRLLGKMRQEAGRLKQTLGQFSGTVATFHSLGLLTRIETARLGSAGADFGNLAEEVRLLARNVQTRVESALDTAGELIPRIETALQEVSSLQEEQAKHLPRMISQVADSLASFREMQREAHDASLRLSAEYGEISESFKRLIMSMQFNDITRQQLEHVIEVLKHFGSGATEADTASLVESAGAARALALQTAQVANAGEKFSTSVASIARSLDEVSAHAIQMVEEGSALSGLSGKSSALRQMERGCGAILSGLTQCAGADEETRQTSEGLSEKIGRMRASIEEIRTIEMQMRRIAMNARISAEHLGPAGEALSALANAIKQRATESRQGSDALVETLDAMDEAVTQLAAHVRPDSGETEAQNESLERMRTAVAALRSSQESSASQVSQIGTQGERLCRGIRAARASFAIGARFAEVVNRTRERLTTLIDGAPAGGGGESDEAAALALARFAGKYTMQEQRDIHLGTSASGAGEKKDAETMDVEFF